MRRTDILIVGGGPAGAAAALVLAKSGATPELIERSTGDRDVVCGGFLGWDALKRLERLGVEAASLGARPIGRLRLVAASGSAEAALPAAAAGLSRRRLDSALLDAAQGAGAIVRRGRSARAWEGGRIRLDDGEVVEPASLFLATGKHELRGLARPVAALGEPPAAGLRAELPPSRERSRTLEGVIELHLFDQGYAGLLLQEDGSANLCLSVSRARLAAAGSPASLIAELKPEAPRLLERIAGDLPERWEAIAGVPYGWRAQAGPPGLFRIGDQAAVIASLAGDGIAIALASGEAAARAWIESGGAAAAPDFQRGFGRRAARPVMVAEALRRSAERQLSRRFMIGALRVSAGAAGLAARLTRIG